MKAAFREQATEYDCVPTSFINALCYLFHRNEIPPGVIRKIYKDCLDLEAARGTSGRAINRLARWLSGYYEKSYQKFQVSSNYLRGKQVQLGDGSPVIQCLSQEGVALLRVHSNNDSWHYILGFQKQGEWLYCFDPLPRSKRFINNEALQFLEPVGRHEANLRIRCDWIDRTFKAAPTPEQRKYIFGTRYLRECLLLQRITP